MVLLSTAYFPPTEYFAVLAKYSVIYLEACENYQKQSYRNRCRFLAADGVQDLRVPVVHENGTFSLPIREIRVDYSTPWVVKTERAIASAYSSSPFFEYYRDQLFAILDAHPETLFELNLRLIRFFMQKCGFQTEIRLTEDFIRPGDVDGLDLREVIHPKRPDTLLEDLGLKKPYYQVFARKYGFKSSLSVMDLLFNEGPNALSFLR